MGKPSLWGMLALALAGCERCGPRTAPEAGAMATDAQVSYLGSMDLRTALFTVFPEFRYAVVTSGHAVVERRIRWPQAQGAPVEAIAPHAERQGFAPADGGHDFSRPPFSLDVEPASPGELRLWVGLPIGQDDVGKLLQSPAPLTSEDLAHWIPMPPGATVVEETFLFVLHYQGSSAQRTDYLVRQMVDLLLAGDWTVSEFPPGWEPGRRADGGVGGVPARFTLTLHRAHAGTRVELDRRGQQVAVKLVQPVRR